MSRQGENSPVAVEKNSDDTTPNKRGGRRRSPPMCRVVGCTEDLSGLKEYHLRYKICTAHHAADVVTQNGVDQRFCQQCAQFHDLAAFDGMKHSCRERLERHNKRRRKQLAESAPENNPSDILRMLDLRSRSGMSSDGLDRSLSSRCDGGPLASTASDGRRLFTNPTFSFSDLRSFSAKRLASYSLAVPSSLPSASSAETAEDLPELSQHGNGIVITTGSTPGSFTSGGSPSGASGRQGVCMATLQQHLLAELGEDRVTTSDSAGYTRITTTTGMPSCMRSDDGVEPATPMSRADQDLSSDLGKVLPTSASGALVNIF